MIYLDHAATTPILPSVREAMKKAEVDFFANASSLHTPGYRAKTAIESARHVLAKLINASPEEIIFTSGSSESNNTVIHTFAGQSIAASTIEHHSVLAPLRTYANPATPINIDKNGKVMYNKGIWLKKPKLISIGLANNELGVLQPISQWANFAHQHHAYFHSDLTQALGKFPLDMKALELDYATFSAHKIGGPLGVGALYVRAGAPFRPFILGGNQENHRRAGTHNTPAIVGFGAALEKIAKQKTWQVYDTKVRPLRDLLAHRILAEIPYSALNTPIASADCLPNILNVSFAAAEGEAIQLYLDAAGIVVSTGSACASGDLNPSHVLMAKTGDAEAAHSSIRFSLGLENTRADIDAVMAVLPGVIHRLQQISTRGLK